MGWPQSVLRLAAVLTNGGHGHLVLVVRLPDGDVVLDNLSRNRPWNALDWARKAAPILLQLLILPLVRCIEAPST
jgi:predicted transglutaminase-like cysteine proteinase